MKTIEAFEKDMYLQLEYLKNFKPQNPLSERIQKNSVFCGSGDSLSSAMLAESFSNFTIRSADPLDILKNKTICKNKRLYLISISGNTISNIKASKISSYSVAITANKNSRLGKICSKTILLDYLDSGVFTAGSVSFLASAMTSVSLCKQIKLPNVKRIFDQAKKESKQYDVTGNIFVLGNYLTYPLAMYCAAKFYEVLGFVAQYERLEQFSHMGMFCSKPKDTVVIFEQKNSHNKHLASNLKKIGLNVIHPNCDSEKISQLLYLVFFSQFLVLNQTTSRKLYDCYFVSASKIRDASSDMIY